MSESNRFVDPMKWSSIVMLAAVMAGCGAAIVVVVFYLVQQVG
jgi:hypothetical protein